MKKVLVALLVLFCGAIANSQTANPFAGVAIRGTETLQQLFGGQVGVVIFNETGYTCALYSFAKPIAVFKTREALVDPALVTKGYALGALPLVVICKSGKTGVFVGAAVRDLPLWGGATQWHVRLSDLIDRNGSAPTAQSESSPSTIPQDDIGEQKFFKVDMKPLSVKNGTLAACMFNNSNYALFATRFLNGQPQGKPTLIAPDTPYCAMYDVWISSGNDIATVAVSNRIGVVDDIGFDQMVVPVDGIVIRSAMILSTNIRKYGHN